MVFRSILIRRFVRPLSKTATRRSNVRRDLFRTFRVLRVVRVRTATTLPPCKVNRFRYTIVRHRAFRFTEYDLSGQFLNETKGSTTKAKLFSASIETEEREKRERLRERKEKKGEESGMDGWQRERSRKGARESNESNERERERVR